MGDAAGGVPGKARTTSDEPTRFACWVSFDPGFDPGFDPRSDPGVDPFAFAPLIPIGPELASARLTVAELDALARTPGVRRIEAARRCHPSLDRSVTDIRADEVHRRAGNPPSYGGYSGSNVVVGIVDTGIDLNHADFLSAGKTRVVALWDQTAVTADPPAGFGYGREWDAAEIDAGAATQTDHAGHGTHVAGIAAGSGAATANGEPAYQYVGVAPEARLVVVKTDFFANSIVDAVAYVFEQADRLGLPAVVNLSMGHQYGPHDGTDTMDLAMDMLAGPGRVIVAAAGNDQQDGIHAELNLSRGESDQVHLEVPFFQESAGSGNDIILIDAYYSKTETVELTVETPGGRFIGPVGPGEQFESDTGEGAVLIENDVFDPPTPDRNLFIQIWDKSENLPAAGVWKLHVENTSGHGTGTTAQTDFWIYAHSLSAGPEFVTGWGRSDAKLVGSPASANEVIAVGSYVTRNGWQSSDGNTYHYNPLPEIGEISAFSSRGPRRDGVLKPEITAPGQGIGSALSGDHFIHSAWVLEDGRHYVAQGTSMASPHVAGVVALLLDAFGDMDKSEIMLVLEEAARSDDHMGTLPNATWGWGKIDALAVTQEPTPIWLIGVKVLAAAEGNQLSWSVPDDLSSTWFRVETAGTEGDVPAKIAFVGPGPNYELTDTAGSPQSQYVLIPTEEGRDLVRLGPFAVGTGSDNGSGGDGNGDGAGDGAGDGNGSDDGSGNGSADGDSTGDGSGGDSEGDSVDQRHEGSWFQLSAPSPNPFSTRTQWNATLTAPSRLDVEIVDATGRRIARVASGHFPSGTAVFGWDGRDALGREVSTGVYWILARADGATQSRRLLLLR